VFATPPSRPTRGTAIRAPLPDGFRRGNRASLVHLDGRLKRFALVEIGTLAQTREQVEPEVAAHGLLDHVAVAPAAPDCSDLDGAQDPSIVSVGGLAVAAHGYPRATKDVDIVPAPDRADRRRLYEALRSLGAQPIEVGDFRPEELPVPFNPDGLEVGEKIAYVFDFGDEELDEAV
jgi:hypothetical protein